jgi:hypothetical protein
MMSFALLLTNWSGASIDAVIHANRPPAHATIVRRSPRWSTASKSFVVHQRGTNHAGSNLILRRSRGNAHERIVRLL